MKKIVYQAGLGSIFSTTIKSTLNIFTTPTLSSMPATSLTLRPSRLRALKSLIAATTSMTAATPEEAMNNFLEMLQNASPSVKLAIALATPWIMRGMALAKYKSFTSGVKAVKKMLISKLTASVTTPGNHPLQKQIMAYMVEQGLGKNARTLALTSPQNESKQSRYDPYYPYYGMQARTSSSSDDKDGDKKDHLNYVPDAGSYSFKFAGYAMTFEKQSS